MNKQLLQALSVFMDQTDAAYQSDEYQHLNKAFEHLNKLYEELADQTDVEELVEEVIQDRKTKRLMKILDEIEDRKATIKECSDEISKIEEDSNLFQINKKEFQMRTVTLYNQSKIIKLLESYILIDSDLA